jgi:hypothetical protein
MIDELVSYRCAIILDLLKGGPINKKFFSIDSPYGGLCIGKLKITLNKPR